MKGIVTNRKNKSSFKCNVLYLIFVFGLLACNNKPGHPADTSANFEENQRIKPLTFSEEKPIVWEGVDPKTIQPPKAYPLDLDKLPSRPFSMPQFQPLQEPLEAHPLHWDNIPNQAIVFDSASTKPFILTSTEIPEPVIKVIDKPIPQEDLKSGFISFSLYFFISCFMILI